MTQKPVGWHQVVIECSDGETTAGASMRTEGSDSTDTNGSVAFCAGCVLRQLGLSEVIVAAEILSRMDQSPDDPCAETLAESAARFLRRRREYRE